MIKKIIALTVFVAFFISGVLGAGWIMPSKAGDDSRLVGGTTEWKYNKLDPSHPAEWDVKGPGNYRLFFRITPNKKGSVILFVDGKNFKALDIEAKKSEKYMMRVDDAKPIAISEAQTFHIKLGKGEHNLKVTSSAEMFVRLVKTIKKEDTISPESFHRALVLLTGNKKSTYFSATPQKPVVFNYDGKCTLFVRSRLAFDKNMKGAQHYTVVMEDNGVSKRIKLESAIIESSRWEDDAGIIPGKAKDLNFILNEGSHDIKLWCDETAAPFCAFKITRKK